MKVRMMWRIIEGEIKDHGVRITADANMEDH
jgi:hypothetical protein